MSTLTTPIQYTLELYQVQEASKRNKSYVHRRRGNKTVYTQIFRGRKGGPETVKFSRGYITISICQKITEHSKSEFYCT